MQKFMAIGNLTRDPEYSETASGTAVCRFSIAVNRRRSGEGEQQTDFFNCTAWRGIADTISRYCKKGQKVAVIGQVQMRQYEDREGVKRTAVDVVVDEIEFLSQKPNDEAVYSSAPKKKPALEPFEGDDDIPF